MKFTVFGGTGFIGGHLSAYLRRRGHEVFVPARTGQDATGQDLGHVVYAIGMTGNFRGKPFATVEAHVGLLSRLLQNALFDSWLYLSSTRVYSRVAQATPVREDAAVSVTPGPDSLYDISKLMGEALCLSLETPYARVARLSNVYGPGQSEHTFLASVISELNATGKAVIRESPASSKDYVAVSDVVRLLECIALSGRERIYNLASGSNVAHAELANKLSQLTGGEISFAEDAPTRAFPSINVSRAASEFAHVPKRLLDDLDAVLRSAPSNPKTTGFP